MLEFDYSLDYDNINFRKNPELYRIGRGEQGVLLVEPYKSEICKYWRFRTPEIAEASANRISAMFHDYHESRECNVMLDLSVGDYIEVFAYLGVQKPTSSATTENRFIGFKISS